MEKKSGKKLLIGIIGAVAVLAALLALVLSQCVGGSHVQSTAPSEQTQPMEETYDLYWNVDRKEYDGKSEAGMSSRKPGSDGYFHVRFFKDGEMLELKVADRKLINTIDTTDLMGLVFDEDGVVVDVIRADRMPLERVGWLFYVQSTGGNLIKLNSSRRMDGLEVLLEVGENTAIYDMTGLEGEVGRKVKMPAEMDRVIAIANLQGEVTHVFVTDRSEFMFGVEAECQHCKQVVTWKKYTKTDEFPSMSGHYILQNDIRFKGKQVQLPEDCSICVDLNGHTVSRTDGGRTIALFNPGVKFALMDSSPEQTGKILVTGTGDQGLGVWLRYGEFHFYGGTIDATAANTRSGGAAVALDSDTYMYMYGGTIRGGNANAEYNEESNAYSRGIGGAVCVRGKMVVYDGLIEGGKAVPILSYNAKGQPVNNRGYGGNIYVGGSGSLELQGGTVRNGYAGVGGGNIYVDGTAELLLSGGTVQGGYVDGRGCNGGSIYVGSKASVVMSAGSVTGGYCFNEGGNIYCGGKFEMQGGYIGGGMVYRFGTGKVNETCGSRNFFLVSGSLTHYAGTIAGGVHAIDSSTTRACTVVLSGSPVIDGGKECEKNLTLNTNGGGVQLYVYQLSDYARVGVGSVGIFSEKTDKANADNFFSDLGADVIHYQDRLAVGKEGCICGSETHFGACDGEKLLWTPYTKSDTLPVTEGYWYLTEDVQLKGQQNIRGKQNVALDLNGHTITTADGSRAYAIFDPEEPITLTLTDSSKEKTGAIVAVGKDVQAEGQCVWIRTAGQTLNLYDVTLDASNAITARQGATLYGNAGTTVNMYAGRILGGTAQAWYKEASKAVVNGVGGNVYTNGIFNMYGGVIEGGKALAGKDLKGNYSGGTGGNLYAGSKAVLNLVGGQICGGQASVSGGNVYISGAKHVSLKGTVISGGVSGDSQLGITGSGGNLATTGVVVLEAGSITGGTTNGNGGNIHITGNGSLNMGSVTVSGGNAARGGNISVFGQLAMEAGNVSGGNAGTGGNIFVYGGKAALRGGKVEAGTATANGGNIYVGADGAEAQISNTVLGGKAKNGGNVAMAQKSVFALLGGSITGGMASENGGSIYAEGGELLLSGGTVDGGDAGTGGNIYLKNASLAQAGAVVTGGKATVNGGNVFIAAGASMTLKSGSVEKGIITRDGAGNIDARGSFTMLGGSVKDGTRVNEKGQSVATSNAKINLFAYKADVCIAGGSIAGGFMAYDAATKLYLNGDSVIDGGDSLPGLTLSGTVIEQNGLTEKAKVVISNTEEGCIGVQAVKTGLVSAARLVLSGEADGKLYLRKHSHCTVCDGFDGQHVDGCEGVDEAYLLWDGGDITEDGIYCVHGELTLKKPVMVTASDATILLDGVVTGEKRGMHIKADAKLTLVGGGTLQAKGNNDESNAVLVVDGKLDIKGVTLRQINDSAVNVKNGGVVTVGAGGEVVMYSGTIEGGTVSNGGGSVFVNGGSFTLKDGTIRGGSASVGGNIFVYGGGSFTQEGGAVAGGTASGQGGNVSVSNGVYTLAGGSVKDGCITADGAGNIDVRSAGTLVVTGGTISGGYRQGGNNEVKRNVFAVNGIVEVTGGEIEGGLMVYGSAKLKVGKAARIVSEGKSAVKLESGALLTVTEDFESTASVVLSSDAGTKIAATGNRAWKANITSDKGLLVSVEESGMYLRTHTHCSASCGQVDGNHAASCAGYDVSGWTVWDGSDITENGNYCIHGQYDIAKPVGVTASDATLLVDGKLISTGRAIMVNAGAKLTLKGTGVVEGKGVNGETTGVVGVSGELILDGITLQQTKDAAVAVSVGGVLRVTGGKVTMLSGTIQNGKATNGGAVDVGSGSFTMNGGTIQNSSATNGGNVFVTGGSFTMNGGVIQNGIAGVGGNVYVNGGSFTMANDGKAETTPFITGGYATNKNGGNVNIAGNGTFTLEEGEVKDGRNTGDGAGNFNVQGVLTISGGKISGGQKVKADGTTPDTGSEAKANIFAYKATLTISGGEIDGGVMCHTADTTLKLGKNARIEASDAGKPSLTMNANSLLTVSEAFESGASVVLSNAVNTKIAASGDHSWKEYITSDKGLKLTVEADGVYLRAADAHVHCLCASTDGKHKEGCNGYDVVFNATTSFPTASGTYFVSPETLSTGALQLGKRDGAGAVNIVLCLGGHQIITPESNTARVALIWKNSSLTITDCGSGSIKPNAKTVDNGSIFHPAAGSTLKIYNGTLDASNLSTEKNGPAIDNAGSTYIYGGTIIGGKTSQNGGSINNSGTLVVDGGTVQDGKAANRGGNIYSSGGSVVLNGTIKNGWVANDSANIDIRGGTLTICGGEIFGGNRYTNTNYTVIHSSSDIKRNIFTVNVPVILSGGTIDGGVQLFKTNGGSATVSGDVKIVATEAGKSSLSSSYVLTIAKPGLGADARIKITSAPAGAFAVAESGLTLTADMASCFENGSGTKATLENNQLLFK